MDGGNGTRHVQAPCPDAAVGCSSLLSGSLWHHVLASSLPVAILMVLVFGFIMACDAIIIDTINLNTVIITMVSSKMYGLRKHCRSVTIMNLQEILFSVLIAY